MTDHGNAGNNGFKAMSEHLAALARMGSDEIAYVKPIRSEDVQDIFPEAPDIAPGLQLFSLHAADGRPILLTDNRDAALAEAHKNDLELVSVH